MWQVVGLGPKGVFSDNRYGVSYGVLAWVSGKGTNFGGGSVAERDRCQPSY